MTDGPADSFVTELRRRGWAVLPAPRQVELDGGTLVPAGARVQCDVGADDIAVRTFTSGLEEEGCLVPPGLDGDGAGGGPTVFRLAVEPDAVATGLGDSRHEQAYRLEISPGGVEVVGNGRPGLFYGVQTLLQLLAGDGRRRGALPTGVITDWPELALRVIHWDTKHHQDRPQTLKRFIDWAGRFKINAVVFELEDKFEYPSHPVLGAPGAFTTAQLQELTDYGLARHVQLIPNVQAPAHMGYVLKHEQFAHLRCDGSNYQICMDEPEARRLIFDMYDDLCRATRGVAYFHVSTDEVYYAGICQKHRRPYNPVNRSLTLVDFVQAAHGFLSQRGRRVILWLEFPILPEHVELLPPDVLDGIMGPNKAPAMVAAANARGIRQFAYCAIQGATLLFPDYFGWVSPEGRRRPGRLEGAFQATHPAALARGRPIGSFAAAWDDAGLHNETFWLGWAAMAQGGWAPARADAHQTAADFMDIYYGREVTDMVEVYRDLQAQARFFQRAWDRRPSKVRPPAYGFSGGKRPVGRTDLTLLPPAVPAADLSMEAEFGARYGRLLAEARAELVRSDRLLGRLHGGMVRARRNRYNLEVLLSLAYFLRHFIEMLLAVEEAEDLLAAAARADKEAQKQRALELMVEARRKVARSLDDLHATHRRLAGVWEKSRFPRNAPVDGREFLHVMDDVKDHFADRRADLSYLIAPAESIGLDRWCDAVGEVIEDYAGAQHLSARSPAEEPLDE